MFSNSIYFLIYWRQSENEVSRLLKKNRFALDENKVLKLPFFLIRTNSDQKEDEYYNHRIQQKVEQYFNYI